MGDLFDWALSMAQGNPAWHNSQPLAWPEEQQRFFAALCAFDAFLASSAPVQAPIERLCRAPSPTPSPTPASSPCCAASPVTHPRRKLLCRRHRHRPGQLRPTRTRQTFLTPRCTSRGKTTGKLASLKGHDFSRLKGTGFTGCGKTPNGRRKGEIWRMQNRRPTLADRSWVILARSIFRAF